MIQLNNKFFAPKTTIKDIKKVVQVIIFNIKYMVSKINNIKMQNIEKIYVQHKNIECISEK